MSSNLPSTPSLEFEKKQAKTLLRDFRAGDAAARKRVRAQLPRLKRTSPTVIAKATLTLADAQLVIARERGFTSWPKLKAHVEATQSLDAQAARFLVAIRESKAATAKRLLSSHPEIAKRSVHTVCAAGDAPALAAALKRDPKLATATDGADRWTPILYACASPLHANDAKTARGLLRCAEILLDAGVDPNSHTLFDEGHSTSKIPALYHACMADHPALVKLLLERGAEPNDGESIYHAAQLNRVACLEVLVAHGADPSGRHTRWGNTPLFFNAGHKENDAGSPAATQGMRWLLEHGADPNVTSTDAKATPLHAILEHGRRAEVVRMFLDHGADPNVARGDDRTPWALAVRGGDLAVIELLRARGAEPVGATPFDELVGACRRSDVESARPLLAAHPRLLERSTASDRSALALAADAGLEAAVRAMVALGFDLVWEGPWAGTALHWAAWRGNVSLTRALLELGAPVNAPDRQFGSSALGWAAHGSRHCATAKASDYVAVVEALLDAGAERAASLNKFGETPESMASPRVEAVLRQRGFAPPR